MRLANEQDQAIIRSAIADSSASSLSFLSSMGQREAIAFGDGVATTMRMKFEALPHSLLPGVKDKKLESIDGKPEEVDLAGIVNRLRTSGRRGSAAGAFEQNAGAPSMSDDNSIHNGAPRFSYFSR